MSNDSKYLQRGVSATKEDVHAAIKNLDKGIFPNAFCKIFPDYLGGDETFCNISHGDGTGTKASLAYIYWKETGDISIWKNLIVDNIVMNLDDMICAGAIDNFLYTSLINRNKTFIPGEVIAALIDGADSFFARMKNYGINIHYMGGETADLGDCVRTITVDASMACRMKRSDVIETNIQNGNVLVGFASFGKAIYEDEYNAGMGSNGLTAARHDVLSHEYATKYPESFNHSIDEKLVYSGTKKLTDELWCGGTPTTDGVNLSVGKAMLSPTRTFAPVMKEIFESHRKKINGIIHCTGGGQGKVLNFIEDLHVIKNNLFATPPLFKLIQTESKTAWSEMYRVFNMGNRMEIYTDEKTASELISIAQKFSVDAQIIGHVEKSSSKKVTLQTENGEFVYAK